MAAKDSGIVNIHGKEYQTVAYRVSKFREQYRPEDGWFITTEIVEADENVVRISAWIGLNVDSRVEMYATGHAEEYRADGKINKTSALENAETSAIGRALACFGLGGTEFSSADEVARAVSGAKAAAPIPMSAETLAEYIGAMDEAKTTEDLKALYITSIKLANHDEQTIFKLTACKDKNKLRLDSANV